MYFLECGVFIIEVALSLVEIAYADRRTEADSVTLANQLLEQGCLTAAVVTEQKYAFAPPDFEAYVAVQLVFTVCARDVLCNNGFTAARGARTECESDILRLIFGLD